MVAGGECESTQFRTSEPLSINDTIGTCSLSKFERSIRPQAYRSSMYRDEYLQNQCHNVCECSNWSLLLFLLSHDHVSVKSCGFYTANRNYCSYAEFRNMTLPYSDVALPGLNVKQVLLKGKAVSSPANRSNSVHFFNFSSVRSDVIAARTALYAGPTLSTTQKNNRSVCCTLTTPSLLGLAHCLINPTWSTKNRKLV